MAQLVAKDKVLVCLTCVVMLSNCASRAFGQGTTRYAIVDIGNIGGSWSATPRAINNEGIVVGDTFDVSTGLIRAFIWQSGAVEFLAPLVPNLDSTAYDINDIGQVIGKSGIAINVEHAVVWRADRNPVDVGTLGGEDSYAYGVNGAGEVVGRSYLPSTGTHPFLWKDGQMIDLGELERPSAGANAINSSRQIVGSAGVLPYGSRGFLWEDGEMINLGTIPEGSTSVAYDISDASVIVGSAHASNGRDQAVVWEDRVIRNIHNASVGSQSIAKAINEVGQIVGYLSVDGQSSGFLYEGNGPMVDVMSLLPPQHQWRQLLNIADINDHGEIVAYGDQFGGSSQAYHAVLLTPVHPILTLQGPQPGRAATINGLRVTGCTPGARVQFFYSRHGGGALIPGCNHTDGVTLQLDNPIHLATSTANEQGVATMTRFVPPVARGQTILFQAVVQNECAISQLVVHTFE